MASSPTSTSPTGKKLVSTKSGMRMICIIDEERSAFEIDEPHWQNDQEIFICKRCGTRFSLTTRRHHCRRCGYIYCSACCSQKIALPRLAFVDPQRVCCLCEVVARKEVEFYDKHLPTLLQGAEFEVGSDQIAVMRCRLDPKTQRSLVFDHIQMHYKESHEPVNLLEIATFQCLTDSVGQAGSTQLIGVVIKYGTVFGAHEVRISIGDKISDRKESVAFLLCLQKAVKMLFDKS